MTLAQAVQLSMDDTISYRVYVSKSVSLAGVTVTANIELLTSSRDDSNTLDAKVASALQDFLPVSWDILSQQRSGATPGYERISLKALAKVPAEENRNLDERARRANREGLEFGLISVDHNLRQDEVSQITKELWFDAIRKVNDHLPEFKSLTGREWRIGDVTLGVPEAGYRTRNAKNSYRDENDEVMAYFGESNLSGSEKISLIANVTLKSARSSPEIPLQR